MPRQIEAAGSTILQSKLEVLGLKIHLSKATLPIGGEGFILEVDMLVISAGIRPRDELAKLAGLDAGMRGGIVVNDEMQTFDPCIFAIGVRPARRHDIRAGGPRLRHGRIGSQPVAAHEPARRAVRDYAHLRF